MNLPARTLSPGIVGAKRAVYEALHQMALEQQRSRGDAPAEADQPQPLEAWFRRDELAQAANVSASSSYLSTVLAWLHTEGLIEYRPGNPGSLSYAAFATSDARR